MPLSLENLDDHTRVLMLAEIRLDISKQQLNFGKRLSSQGQRDYPNLIVEAAQSQNDTWLAAELRKNGRMVSMEERRTPSGGTTTVKVPVTASETFAEGEFNRFYARALAARAVRDKVAALIVYRAKQVTNPRHESEKLIGQPINPQALLDDLRTNINVDTALGIPAGPNSGLSVRLP